MTSAFYKYFYLAAKIKLFLLWSSYAAVAVVPHELTDTKLRTLYGSDMNKVIVAELGNLGMNVRPKLNPLRRFPICSENLKILPTFGSWKTARIICDGKENWKTNVRTNLLEIQKNAVSSMNTKPSLPAKISERNIVKVVILATDLKSGQIISASDLQLSETEKFVSQSYFTNISEVVGRKLKSGIKTGKILQDRHLTPNWTIIKEQPIIIEAKNASFSVYADGIALSNGYLGDMIKVRNTGSGNEFYAWVASKKKVHPIANINQD